MRFCTFVILRGHTEKDDDDGKPPTPPEGIIHIVGESTPVACMHYLPNLGPSMGLQSWSFLLEKYLY